MAKIHPGIFGQIVVMRLFHDHNMLAQICGNNLMTLKMSPPLVIRDEEIDRLVSALDQLVGAIHHPVGFWTETLGIAQRVMATI